MQGQCPLLPIEDPTGGVRATNNRCQCCRSKRWPAADPRKAYETPQRDDWGHWSFLRHMPIVSGL